MTQVIDGVVNAAQGKGAIQVLSVRLQVGELTFLAEDQLLFAFDVLKKDHNLLENAQLVLERTEARGVCQRCGFSGQPAVADLPEYHLQLPTLDCPECGEQLSITEGRDLYIRDIALEVPDDGTEESNADGDVKSAAGGG
jgi:hydrogenase nickel insertion protein HypA